MSRFRILDRRLFQLGLGITLAMIIADQVSKLIIMRLMQEHPFGLPILPFFSLVTAWNPGVSFSMFRGAGPALLSGGAILVSLGLLVWLARTDSRFQAIAIGLIAGGALGNVIDRLRYGAVFDFLDVFVRLANGKEWHWPAFNLADSGITVGVILLLIHGLFQRGDRARP